MGPGTRLSHSAGARGKRPVVSQALGNPLCNLNRMQAALGGRAAGTTLASISRRTSSQPGLSPHNQALQGTTPLRAFHAALLWLVSACGSAIPAAPGVTHPLPRQTLPPPFHCLGPKEQLEPKTSPEAAGNRKFREVFPVWRRGGAGGGCEVEGRGLMTECCSLNGCACARGVYYGRWDESLVCPGYYLHSLLTGIFWPINLGNA